MLRLLTTSLAAIFLAMPIAASSQGLPSYAYAGQSAAGDQQIRGRITNFDGGYNLSVRDERGYVDNVALHPGTIINPTGLTLAPGMIVSILGYNAGDAFAANEIDTPYSYSSGVPYYYGHPWNYYGSGINLGFFFGNLGWWHGRYFHGGYAYYGGARCYSHVRFRDFYDRGGGSFHGRAYVASAARGGYYRSGIRIHSNVNVNVYDRSVVRHGYESVHTTNHYARRPAADRYTNSQAAFQSRPQYHREARPQYRAEARPQYHAEARPQYHAEARPQYHAEARPSHAENRSHGDAGGHSHEDHGH